MVRIHCFMLVNYNRNQADIILVECTFLVSLLVLGCMDELIIALFKLFQFNQGMERLFVFN